MKLICQSVTMISVSSSKLKSPRKIRKLLTVWNVSYPVENYEENTILSLKDTEVTYNSSCWKEAYFCVHYVMSFIHMSFTGILSCISGFQEGEGMFFW